MTLSMQCFFVLFSSQKKKKTKIIMNKHFWLLHLILLPATVYYLVTLFCFVILWKFYLLSLCFNSPLSK